MEPRRRNVVGRRLGWWAVFVGAEVADDVTMVRKLAVKQSTGLTPHPLPRTIA